MNNKYYKKRERDEIFVQHRNEDFEQKKTRVLSILLLFFCVWLCCKNNFMLTEKPFLWGWNFWVVFVWVPMSPFFFLSFASLFSLLARKQVRSVYIIIIIKSDYIPVLKLER